MLGAATVYGEFYTKHDSKKYFKYYDIVTIRIDDVSYEGIILDTCGACSFITHENRLDLFVSSKKYGIDRGYRGNNSIYVDW